MFAVDLIIVDHVITALGEALQTDKPVIVYDPGSLDRFQRHRKLASCSASASSSPIPRTNSKP